MAGAVTLPPWNWAYAAFKLADGLTHGLVALAILLWYDGDPWLVAAVAAAMNLAGVPAAFMWGKVMTSGRGRRRIAMSGFAFAAIFLAVAAIQPGLAVFLVAMVGFTVFGIATAPAAGVLILEAAPRDQWGEASGILNRRTGFAYLGGVSFTLMLALTGLLELRLLFLAGAVLTIAAAMVAAITIPHFDPDQTREMTYKEEVVRQSHRRFERPVYFPTRLWYGPTRRSFRLPLGRPPADLLLAVVVLFAGTVVLLGGYPGILSSELGYGAGLILLAQAPAAFATTLVYARAGRYGSSKGEARAIALGAMMRLAAIPGMALAIFALGGGALVPLLFFHALMGVSFAYLQVNGPCFVAQHHPRGRGAGVGAYHAALGMGTLTGSVVGAVVLWAFPLWALYATSAGLTVVGVLALINALGRIGQEDAVPVVEPGA